MNSSGGGSERAVACRSRLLHHGHIGVSCGSAEKRTNAKKSRTILTRFTEISLSARVVCPGLANLQRQDTGCMRYSAAFSSCVGLLGQVRTISPSKGLRHFEVHEIEEIEFRQSRCFGVLSIKPFSNSYLGSTMSHFEIPINHFLTKPAKSIWWQCLHERLQGDSTLWSAFRRLQMTYFPAYKLKLSVLSWKHWSPHEQPDVLAYST